MANMFGLPDEVMDAVIRSAIRNKMSGESKMESFMEEERIKPIEKKDFDPTAKAAESAKKAEKFYKAYIKQRFTPDQAFELIKGNLYCKF